MAQLLIIIGFASGNWREDTPEPVYMGRDDEAGEQAMRESKCPLFHMHRNLGAAHRRERPAPLPVAVAVAAPAPAPAAGSDSSEVEAPAQDSEESAPAKKAAKKAAKK